MKTKQCKKYFGYSVNENGTLIYSHRKRRKLSGKHGSEVFVDFKYLKQKKSYANKKGYLCVGVVVAGKKSFAGVHQMVADAFIGVCPVDKQVRHLDGNPKNNHYTNLSYGTIYENNQDRKRHGTYTSGGKHHNSKLTNIQAGMIRKERNKGIKVLVLSKKYSVSVSVIESIIYNKSYL